MEEKQLTRRQEAFIASLLEHATVKKAAQAANVPESTAWRWLNSSPEFNSAYRKARRKLSDNTTRVLQMASAACAVKLARMAHDETLPPGIQYAAASRVIELANRGEEIQDLQAELEVLKAMVIHAPESTQQKGLRRVV